MILKFDIDGVQRILNHLEKCKEFKKTYGQEGTDIPNIWLVKDHGVYLMSNGITEIFSPVIYAKGLDPDKDEDWYDKAYELGGDDFCELVGFGSIKRIIQQSNPRIKYLTLKITSTEIEVYGSTC